MNNLNNLVSELKNKRAYLQDQIHKIDAVLSSLEKIDGISDKPVEVWVRENKEESISFHKETLHPHDLARKMIREKGDEVRLRDLYTAYCKSANVSIPKGRKEKTKHYINFSSYFSKIRCARAGFVKKLYKLEGVGREVYINVDSALKLQTEKMVQNPRMETREII